MCALAAISGALLLAGCGTTQQEAARLQLNSARIRATEQPLRVTRPATDVRVAGLTVLDGDKGTAFVVRLRSSASGILTDLPISVGVLGPHNKRQYLNGAVGSDYFDSHVAAIPPRAEMTWVLTTRRHVSQHARPFATVGTPVPGFSSARSLPKISVTSSVAAGSNGPLELTVHNPTGVPQYGLQVFATVTQGGAYVAAGKAEIAHLGTGSSTSVRINLLGKTTTAAPALQATPTIFG
jgi:hypothetical protein